MKGVRRKETGESQNLQIDAAVCEQEPEPAGMEITCARTLARFLERTGVQGGRGYLSWFEKVIARADAKARQMDAAIIEVPGKAETFMPS